MAGHSKWANIKHKKDRADKKKGKVFSRCAKEIISAVREGGPDPKANTRLRLAIQKAKAANVPNDVVDRNVKKATSADQADFHEMTYELYGHGGVGIIADVMTDNKNRIASDMRIATNKKGGTVAQPGAVSFNFDRKGVITISKKNAIEDELFLAVSEAGAEDLDSDEESFIVLTDPVETYSVKEALEGSGFVVDQVSLEMIPKNLIEVDEEMAQANQELMDWIEDLDDVDAVFHNMAVK